MTWTPQRIAEFEGACDLRQLRRDNPMPGLATVDQAVGIVRHALIAFASPPDGELVCTADRAATRAVQALTGAWLLHLSAADPRPDCPNQYHGADGGPCPTCGWDSHPIPTPGHERPETPLAAVARERESQDARWGEQNHPDGTGGPHETVLADAKRQLCQAAANAGVLTWRDVLDEEVAEAFAETDPAKLRAELVQVAAVAVAWVEAIDRRTAG